jgi:hypothetical protein
MDKVEVVKDVPKLAYTFVVNFDILADIINDLDLKEGRFNLLRFYFIGENTTDKSSFVKFSIDLIYKDFEITKDTINGDQIQGKFFLRLLSGSSANPDVHDSDVANIVFEKSGLINELITNPNKLYSTQETIERHERVLLSEQTFSLKVRSDKKSLTLRLNSIILKTK